MKSQVSAYLNHINTNEFFFLLDVVLIMARSLRIHTKVTINKNLLAARRVGGR